MTPRSKLVLTLLPLMLALERAGQSITASVLALHLKELGVDVEGTGRVFAVGGAAALVGVLAGGVLCVWAGARVTAAVMAFVSAAGYFALAMGAPPALALALCGLRVHVFPVCLIAIGTDVLRVEGSKATRAYSPHRFVLGAALSVSLVAVAKLVEVVSPVLGAVASRHGYFALPFALSGLALTLAAILGVALVRLAREASRAPGAVAEDTRPRVPGLGRILDRGAGARRVRWTGPTRARSAGSAR